MPVAVPSKLVRSTNANRKRAAGHGRGDRGRGHRFPLEKGFISAHTDDATKKATFDMGNTAGVTMSN